jgi:PAS domain S-box-containing protein
MSQTREFGTVKDIAEREQTEDALLRTVAELKEAQRVAHVGSWSLDSATNQVSWSEELFRMLGMDPALTPPPYTEHQRLFTPESWSQLSAALPRTLETGAPYQLELEMVRPDGSKGWMLARGEPRRDARGRIIGARGTAQDITERVRREEDLRRFRAAMDASGDAIALVDRASLRYVDFNQTFCDLVGYTRQELLGMTPADVFSADRETLERDYDAIIADKYSRFVMIQGQYRRKDGALIPIESRRRAMHTANGWVIVATARDITERKRAEQDLRRFRLAMDATEDSIYLTNPDTMRFVDVNLAACRRTGYTREQLLRMGPHDLLGKDPAQVRNDYRQVIAAGDRGIKTENTFVASNGSRGWTELYRRAFRVEGGLLIVTVGRDISEQKRAQDALRESEQRFRAIFERSTAGIATWGLDGRFLTVNSAFCDFVGYAADQLVGKMSAGDLRQPGEDEGLELTGRMLRREISHLTRDRRYRKRDGSTVWGRTTVAAVTGMDATVQYFVAVVIDITEARQARERIEEMNAELEQRVRDRTGELRSAVEKLKEANQDLDSFNFSIAHDLRQPLNAIVGFSDLLQEEFAGPTSGAAREFASEIGANAVRMEQMIKALLGFSNVGRGALDIVQVDMRRQVEAVVGDLKRTAPAHTEIRIGELPEARGDESLLRHVWANLIGNALKYSARNPAPKVEISGVRRDGALEYTVRDNGVGFDMRYAGDLFGVFQRLPTSAEFEGAGVGLAIVQRIVRRHGGTVGAESAPGEGATFRFTLPA